MTTNSRRFSWIGAGILLAISFFWLPLPFTIGLGAVLAARGLWVLIESNGAIDRRGSEKDEFFFS